MFRFLLIGAFFGFECLLAWLFSSETHSFDHTLLLVLAVFLATNKVDTMLITYHITKEPKSDQPSS